MSMEEFQRYLEKYQFRQKKCVYPLFFQEYIYALALHYGLNVPIEPVKNQIGYDSKFSFILIKRLIIRLYQPNFLMNSVANYNYNQFNEPNRFFYYHFFSQMISEGFALVVEIPFSLHFSISKKEIKKLQNLRSIHSIFSFLEDKLSYFNYVSDIIIPYPIHFEILVQILQCWIQDIPALHLLQFFLFNSSNCKSFFTSKKQVSIYSKENKRFFWFLYNSYVFECEFVFLFLRKKSFCLRLISSRMFSERIYFYRKIQHIIIVYNISLQKTLWVFTDPFMNYVRYQSKAILASKSTFFFIKKWKSYLACFWQYYLHFWSNPNRIHINEISYYSFYFLGFFSSVKKDSLVLKSQILESLVLIDTITKKFDSIVPVILLIKSLSKAAFCTVSGHPISKPTWTDLSDCDILNRFAWISRNLFHYYSGSSKKKTLYRIKYILRLSCARTLARKHKSTVRTFLQRLGSQFLEEFFTEEEQVLPFILRKTKNFPLHRSNNERIWYFDITRINDLINNLEFWL
uniref:maturase K n=1 Tax=Scleria parvula TaxID=388579 RepID=UPI001F13D772|nr:maturase K [Scleria parvula]ULQ67610.1 maturase K [Scleria parvula]